MEANPTGQTVLKMPYDPAALPIGQLESLRFKANQIVESIQGLIYTLDTGLLTSQGYNPHMLPPWPDILAKYSLLVSQTHTLSHSLTAAFATQPPPNPAGSLLRPKVVPINPFQKLALHPGQPVEENTVDGLLLPMLRTKPNESEWELENLLVARLRRSSAFTSATMNAAVPRRPGQHLNQDPNAAHTETLQKCEAVRTEHDARAERAARAVHMLREKFDVKARVDIEFPPTPPPLPPMEEMEEMEDQDDADDEDKESDGSESSDDPEALGDMVEEVQGEAFNAGEGEDDADVSTPQSGIFTPT